MSGTGWRFGIGGSPASGTRTQGFVDWGDSALTGWDWPYVAVNGTEPGPAVLVTAGIHGSEYPSIDAALRFGAALDPARVRGQVLCLPVMNPAAFWGRVAYVSPVDRLNLNRVFPGKADGTFSERLAFRLMQAAILKADFYIDLHGGDLPEALVPFAMYFETGRAEVDAKSRAMALAFGSEGLLVQKAGNQPNSGQTYASAAQHGIPAIIAEDGGAGQYDPAITQRLLDGLENVLRSQGVLPGTPAEPPPPRLYARFAWLRARKAGFFRAEVKVGDEVAAGQCLGRMFDFFGNVTEEIAAPGRGRVLFLLVSPAIADDGLICGIGVDP